MRSRPVIRRRRLGPRRGGCDLAARQGQAYPPEDAPFGCAEAAGSAFAIAVNRFESRTRGFHEQRNGMKRRRNYRRAPGEYQRRSGERFPGAARPTVASDHHQQVVAKDRGRKRQWQRGNRIEHFFARELSVHQQPRQPQPESEREKRSARRDFEAEPEREPVHLHSFGFSFSHNQNLK